MDHSFSIDTCLYNKDDDNELDQTVSLDSSSEDENYSEQVENELGILDTRRIKSSKYDEPKEPIFKKFTENLSKLNLSDTVNSLKTYLDTKKELFECINPKVDTNEFEEKKSNDSVNSTTLQASTSEDLDFSSKSMEGSDSKPPSRMSSFCSLKDIALKNSFHEEDKHLEVECKLNRLKSSNLPPSPGLQPVSTKIRSKSELERETLERVSAMFVDHTDLFARMAIDDNQHMLADKLVCNAFKKLKEVYDRNFEEKYDNFVDSQGCYPLYNLDFNLPKGVPDSVRSKFEEMAVDPLYQNNVAERIFVLSLFTKFKMLDLIQLSLKYHHTLVTELWDLCVDSIVNKTTHDPVKLFKFRNNILNTTTNKKNVEYKNLPSIELEGETERSEIQVEDEDFYFTRCNTGVFSDISSETSTTSSQFDLVASNDGLNLVKDPLDKGGPKDKWYKEVYVKQSELMSYLRRTNRLYNSERLDLLRGNFNISGNKGGSGFWVHEPNNCLQTFNLSDKEFISIKVRGKLPCHIITALKIITDIDISNQWIPYLKESKNLHIHSLTSRIFKQIFEYPVTGHKEALIYGLSTNLLDEANCVIISTSNPPSDKKDGDNLVRVLNKGGLSDTGNYIKVEKNECTFKGFTVTKIPKKQKQKTGEMCFLLYPYSENETLMEIYGTFHQESRVIPVKFITFLLKKVIIGMFRKMAIISKNLQCSNSSGYENDSSDLIKWMESLHKKYKESNPQAFKEEDDFSFYTFHLDRG